MAMAQYQKGSAPSPLCPASLSALFNNSMKSIL